MTHTCVDIDTQTHAQSHLCHGSRVLWDTAGEENRETTPRSCTMCLPLNPFLSSLLSFVIFFLILSSTHYHKHKDTTRDLTLTKPLFCFRVTSVTPKVSFEQMT
ncbi:hypothetical protein CRENBAI_001944 [Crenichthys baileyi]|uniref:Uncharacterized protein n=1 Tax=Crenichthys baileyi TaxID=28760 RepID=A0AAV9RZ93_9TELE